MPKVVIEQYGDYWDRATKTQFAPVLDRRTGTYIGAADVTDGVAANLAARPGRPFRVLTDEEYREMTEAPKPAEKNAPVTGDVLSDQEREKAKKRSRKAGEPSTEPSGEPSTDLAGPPPPPESR